MLQRLRAAEGGGVDSIRDALQTAAVLSAQLPDSRRSGLGLGLGLGQGLGLGLGLGLVLGFGLGLPPQVLVLPRVQVAPDVIEHLGRPAVQRQLAWLG